MLTHYILQISFQLRYTGLPDRGHYGIRMQKYDAGCVYASIPLCVCAQESGGSPGLVGREWSGVEEV